MKEVPKKPVEKTQQEVKRLYRSGKEKILGGVCGGIGEYFSVDPVLIRILLVVLFALSGGLGILAYFIAWIIVPRNPDHDWTDDD
ncbi:PspC domain-containing protein [archaeon]|nr:PspC domain-containing protein [archaeon]